MNDKQINAILRRRAVACGLCHQWQQDWRMDWDEAQLFAKYKEGIDFCLANNFPNNLFIKKTFSMDSLRAANIFVDDAYSILNADVAVIKGRSDIKARYNGTSAGTIYATDRSKLEVFARGSSFVVVHALGAVNIVAHQDDNAILLIIKHSLNVRVLAKTGNIKMKTELNWLHPNIK